MRYKLFLTMIIAGLLLVTSVVYPAHLHGVQAKNLDQSINESMSSNTSMKKATVFYERYDAEQQSVVKQPIKDISLDDAFHIRDELLLIQETYESTRDRINAQINLLKESDLIPDDISLKRYTTQLALSNDLNKPSIEPAQSSVTPNVIICGPALTSFLTVGGPLLPLHTLLFNILPPFWYNSTQFEFDPFTGTKVATFIGLLPVVAFYCTATTLINAYGAVIGEHSVISPFIALMILHAGFGLSISIFDDEFPVNIFDWSLGLSATGLIAYIQVL